MAKVVIIVSGGVIQAVESDQLDLQVKIIDTDNLSAEGIKYSEIEDYISQATSSTESIMGNQL